MITLKPTIINRLYMDSSESQSLHPLSQIEGWTIVKLIGFIGKPLRLAQKYIRDDPLLWSQMIPIDFTNQFLSELSN